VRACIEAVEPRVLLAAVDVLTWHNDDARQGLNDRETNLTVANVNQATFGKLFSLPVDGQVYAQPLYVSNLDMPGVGVRNVVFAATQHNSVYAFNADAAGGPLWHAGLNPPGATPIPQMDTGVSDIVPEVGITSTPVIDRATATIYVVARTKEAGTYVQRIHALDLYTGAPKFGGPTVITAPSFHPLKQNQRPGLALVDGAVVVAWASHGDVNPYKGYVIAYDARTLRQVSVFDAAADTDRAGIWMSGAAPAVDGDGNLYFMTGNGPANAHLGGRSYGQSVVKIKLKTNPDGTRRFDVVDYFTPFNFEQLEIGDTDLGSGGLMLLPDQPGPHPHLVVGGGKQGRIYVMDRDDLGQWTPGRDDIVQVLDSQMAPIYSTPAYFDGAVYYQGTADYLKRFEVTDGRLSPTWTDLGPTRIEFPGPSPVITANGTADGIVWIYSFGQNAVLHAYDATTLAELYNSNQSGPRDRFGGGVKFAVPTVTNGKVYLGGDGALTVFGTINIPPTIPDAPSGVTAHAVDPTRVSLSWQDNSGNEIAFVVERSTDGVSYSEVGSANANVTVFTDALAAGNTAYYYRVRAISNAGASAPTDPPARVTTPAPPYVGYWQFDEGAGGTTADASGNGANGVLSGETTWLPGRVGPGALNFHGAGVQDAHVEADDHPAIRFSAAQGFTLSAWVSPGGFRDKWAGIVTKSADRPGGYGLYLTAGNKWAFAASSADANALVSPADASEGWHHVAAVQRGDTGVRELWVDGVLVASGVVGGPGAAADADGTGKLFVGGSAGTIQEYFGGAVDDVRVYARALSGAELAGLAVLFNPAAPSGLALEALSSSRIRLTWQDGSSNEDGFVVERSTDNQQFNPVATVAAGVTTYEDAALLGSTRYYYRVRAANAAGASGHTAVQTAITQIGTAVATYRFVEGEGTVVTDGSGRGNTGTLGGGVAWTTQGRVALGLRFDGSGYVTIPDAPSVNPTGGLSVAAWVKADYWNGGSRIISKGRADDQYNLFNAGGMLNFRLTLVGQIATPVPSAGAWHHVAATYDNATMRIYVDGVLAASAPAYGPLLTTTDPLYFGSKVGPGGTAHDSFVGVMDEVYVFERAITAAEVSALAHPFTEPDDPSNLAAVAASTTQVDLTWNDNSGNEEAWLIERSPDGLDWVPLAIPPGSGGALGQYSDTTVQLGRTYFYRVRAQNPAGPSEYTNVAVVTTPVDSTPPTLAAPAVATPGRVTSGTTAALAALGADNSGEESLTYTWAAVSGPAGAPALAFSANGDNSAKDTVVTFGRAGTYTLEVTIRDPGNLTVKSRVTVVVDQVATAVVITPGAVVLPLQTTRQFTASLRDQFGDPMPVQPAFAWSLAPGGAGGTISPGGLYTSPGGLGGDTVRATAGALVGTAAVVINPGPQFPATFTGASGLTLGGAARIVNGRLRLTEPGPTWAGGAFYSTKTFVGTFTVDFAVRMTDAFADGFAFVLQNQAANAVGGGGGGLGYYGIASSVAVKFSILGGTSTGLVTHGTLDGATIPMPVSIDFRNGRTFRVRLVYDGGTLTVKTTDAVTGATATQAYAVDIPAVVGGQTAWMGFTGGTAWQSAVQEITSWTYSANIPDTVAPAATGAAFAYAAHPHTLTVTFGENVAASLAAGDLTVRALDGGATYTPTSVTFDPATNAATFAFAGELPDGRYRATLAAGAVSDAAGNLLATDATFDFFSLAGDATRDGRVDFADLVALAQHYDQMGGMTWADGDFTGDGNVDFNDLVVLAQRYDTVLAGAPVAASAGPAEPFAAAFARATAIASPVATHAPKPAVAKPAKPTPQRPAPAQKPPTKAIARPVSKPVAARPAVRPPSPFAARKIKASRDVNALLV
jgi:hypothetical protein